MSLPCVDLSRVAPRDALAALQEHGALLVRDPHATPALAERALADVRAFFEEPDAAKEALAIERSPHFRGYSRMHNERDFREQLHFGPEREARASVEPFWLLQGPNPWPSASGWRERMQAWFAASERAGRRLLDAVAAALDVSAAQWLGDAPYVLAKCIGYHAQSAAGSRRRGVAAHLDFSLLTLTLQDDTGGLEVRGPDGAWRAVPPERGAWLVNVGELLQLVSGNRLIATPHRVVNPSAQRMRVSIPVFLCPALDATLRPALDALPLPAPSPEHVHAVLDPERPPAALHFGAAEWRRKGENRWCAACAPGPASARTHA